MGLCAVPLARATLLARDAPGWRTTCSGHLTLPTGRGRPSGVKKTDEFHIKPLASRGRHESELRPFCVVARGLRGRPRRGRKRLVFVLLRRVSGRFGPIRPHPNARLCSRAYLRVRPDNTICRFAGTLAGATGLEPATSGVTGRSWRFRAERGSAGISGRSRPFSPARCGDLRVPAAIPGSLVRDQRGMSRCLIRQLVGGRPVESSDGLEPSTPSLPLRRGSIHAGFRPVARVRTRREPPRFVGICMAVRPWCDPLHARGS